MFVAFSAWLISLGVFLAIIAYFFRMRALCALASMFFLAILVLVRPVILMLNLDVPLMWDRFNGSLASIGLASLAAAVWGMIVMFSFVLCREPMGAAGRQIMPAGSIAPPKVPTRAITLVLSIAAVGGTLWLVRSNGSVAAFMYAVKIGKDLKGSYWIKLMAVLSAILCLYGLFSEARRVLHRGHARKILPKGAALYFGPLIVTDMAANYFWGNRMAIALFIFMFGLGFHFYVRPFRLRELAVAGALAAIGLYGLGQLRKGLVVKATGRSEVQWSQDDVRAFSNSLHFVEFDGLVLALRDTGTLYDYRYGKDFYNGLISWIPRAIMPDRETYKVGSWFRREYEPAKINGWPITVVGDWYVNFGILGILFGAFISGAALAAVDGAYAHAKNNAWHAVMAPAFGFFLLAGGIDSGFPQYVVAYVVPFALFGLFMRLVSRSRKLSLNHKPTLL